MESEEHRVRINLGHTEDDYRESNHIPIEGKKSLTTSRTPPLPHDTSFYKKSNHCRLTSQSIQTWLQTIQQMQDLTALYMIWAYKVSHDCLLSLKLCLAHFQILLSNFIQIQVLMKAIQLCHNFLTLTFSVTLNLIVSYFAVSLSSSNSIKN